MDTPVTARRPVATADPLVKIESIRHVYRAGEAEHLVLEDVDLCLRSNEIVALLGRSGCGKSTLLRIIAGLLKPTSGTVKIGGAEVDGPARQVAMVFQSFALFPWLTVLENVEIGLEAQRVDPRFREQVDVSDPRMTSGPAGQAARQRFPGTGISIVLPRVSSNVLAALIEAVAAEPYNGRADLPPLAASLQMEIDDLFPVAETLQLFRFAEVAEGDIRLTEAGKRFVRADFDDRKRLFKQHLLTYVPLAGHIKHVLDER